MYSNCWPELCFKKAGTHRRPLMFKEWGLLNFIEARPNIDYWYFCLIFVERESYSSTPSSKAKNFYEDESFIASAWTYSVLYWGYSLSNFWVIGYSVIIGWSLIINKEYKAKTCEKNPQLNIYKNDTKYSMKFKCCIFIDTNYLVNKEDHNLTRKICW